MFGGSEQRREKNKKVKRENIARIRCLNNINFERFENCIIALNRNAQKLFEWFKFKMMKLIIKSVHSTDNK